MKSSKVRELRDFLGEIPGVTPEIVEILVPKREVIHIAKLYFIFFVVFALSFLFCRHNRASLIIINNYPRFFQIRDGPFIPTLRVLHRCLNQFHL